MTPTDYDSYRTLEEAIAALEDLYATGEVSPSEQPRIEHRPGEPRPYVIVIGSRIQSVCAAAFAQARRGGGRQRNAADQEA